MNSPSTTIDHRGLHLGPEVIIQQSDIIEPSFSPPPLPNDGNSIKISSKRIETSDSDVIDSDQILIKNTIANIPTISEDAIAQKIYE